MDGYLTAARSARAGSLRRIVLASLTALLVLLTIPALAGAEAPSNAGKEFWIGFPSNYEETPQLTLYITGGTATTGTVAVPGLSFSETFSVTPGKVTAVKLPETAQMTADGTEEKAISVTAEAPVVVYGLSDIPFTTDAYTALPTSVDGTSYTVLAFGYGQGGNSEFSVVATQNGTKVTITPSVEGAEAQPAGTPFTVTLNQGQEYQLTAAVNPEDLTGTKITATAPVAVFGGQRCANIPTNEFVACDYVVEQNTPESAWGTSFLTVPLKTRLNGDDFEVVADQSETHVKLNGSLVATLAAGQKYAQEVAGDAEWSSDKPVALAQYSNSSSYDNTTGDPFMIGVPPYQQFETEYTVTTPVNSSTVFGNYINLTVPKSAVGLVKVDGTAVPSAEYSAIGSSGFYGAEVSVEPGSHVITGNGQPFGVSSYGFSEYNGYGYFGGMSLAPVATVAHVTLEPPTESAKVNTKHCVTAAVTDESNKALGGVRVDFKVTGANTAEESVFANEEGKATFCYTGTHAGKDTITGSVGLVSGTAEKTWEEETTTEEGPSLDAIASSQHQKSTTTKLTTKESGDLIVAFVGADGPYPGGTPQTTVVSGGGLTWTFAGRTNAALGDAEVWYAKATGKLNEAQITANANVVSPGSPYGQGYDVALTVAGFKNAPGIGTVQAFSNKKAAPTGTIKTAHANSWVWASGDDWLASIKRTPGPSQTVRHEAFDAVGDTYWVQSTQAITKTAGTSVMINDTAPSGDPFDLVLVEIL